MTIEAGALALRITEVGAEQVLKTLTAIDQKATALGGATQSVKFNTSSLTSANGQLQQLGANFTTVERASAAATPALQAQAQAQAKVAATAAAVGAETAGLSRAATSFAGVAASLGALGIVFSAGTILSGIVSLARDAIDAGDSLHDLAMRTGISVETLSILGPVAAKSGASTDLLATGFRNLSKEVEKLRSGNKEATETFAALGLSAKDIEGLSLDQVFVKVADALNQFEDGSFKTAEAVKLFGRAGDQLIPTLHELADGGFQRAKEKAEELGGVISTDFADKADKFNDDLVDMHTALSGLGRALGEAALPGLTRLAELLTTLIVKGRGFISILTDAAKNAGLLMLLGPLGPAVAGASTPGKDHVIGLSFQQTTGLMTPPERASAMTAAQRKAALDAAEAARIQRLLERTAVGMPGITDMLGATGKITPELGAPSVGVDSKGKMKGVKAFGMADVIDSEFDKLEAKMKERQERLQTIVGSIAQSVGNAFGDAFSSAFKGGNFFEEFGKSLLASLGNILVQLGGQLLAYGLIIAPLAALLAFTPFGGLGLGAGASIAAGLALTALGAAMGAVGGGGGTKGGGGGGAASSAAQNTPNQFEVAFDPDRKLRKRQGPAVIPSSRSIDGSSMPDARPVIQIGTLNALHPDDPRWQRELAATYNNATSRGLIKKAG